MPLGAPVGNRDFLALDHAKDCFVYLSKDFKASRRRSDYEERERVEGREFDTGCSSTNCNFEAWKSKVLPLFQAFTHRILFFLISPEFHYMYIPESSVNFPSGLTYCTRCVKSWFPVKSQLVIPHWVYFSTNINEPISIRHLFSLGSLIC